MTNNLTPYDTGEVLEPQNWPLRYGEELGEATAHTDFGKVDFDNDESATEFTVQIVKNDPLPATGERYTIRITNHSGEAYIIQEEG